MTLAQAIHDDRITMETLHQRYAPVLNLVDVLIGVVPNCDTYLEVWPPGFRTYNLMVPNFLNLPHSLFGRAAPKDLVGLGMYASSRAASCNYCSAHTCSFALRRGSSAAAVSGESRTAAEAAVVAAAEALSSDPHHYTDDTRAGLRRHFSAENAEWIIMGVAMMGFLNKFMDAMGVELEPEAVGDVSALISPTGWSVGQHDWADGGLAATKGGLPPHDSRSTMLKVLRNAPGALWLEREWMEGIPKDSQAARALLRETYFYDEELLGHMMHARPRRALAAMLRHNLDPRQSAVGIGNKALASSVFAQHVNSAPIRAQSLALADRFDIPLATIEMVEAGVDLRTGAPQLDDRTSAIMAAALAMAPSPARVDATTVKTVTDHLSSAEIVEIAVWISIAQLQHRLLLWYGLSN